MSMPAIASDSSLVPFLKPSAEEIERRAAKLSLLFDRYKHKISTLPKENTCWIDESLYMYQGFWLMSKRSIFSVETMMAAQDTFQAHPNDIYLATLPKSGTTWIKALAFATMNRKLYENMPFSTHPLILSNPQQCVPSIEGEILQTNPSYLDAKFSRLFATHIPYASLPRSVLDSGCRLVYMCRNPKDVFVSLFHFVNKMRSGHCLDPMTIEEAFHMFSKGVNAYGPYWDHVKAYYNASLEHPTRVLFLTYENVKLDTVSNVKRLAEFLGFPFTEEEMAKGVVEEIVSLCSFENLKEVNKHGDLRPGVPNNIFLGKVKSEIGTTTSQVK